MVEYTHEKVTVDAPLIVVASVLENAGYQLAEVEDETALIGFAIPHNFDGHCEAVVEFLPGVGLLQMSTSLTRGDISPVLVPGLYKLLNELNVMMPGVSFTYDQDEALGDDIQIFTTCYVFDEIQLEEHVKLMVKYLEEALKLSLSAIYHFVTQRIRLRAELDGTMTFLGPTLTVRQVLDMVEMNQFGRA